MRKRSDSANTRGSRERRSAIDLIVEPGPRAQLMALISLGQQRYRVACVPVADEFGLELGDEIELTDTPGGGHLFRAVVAKPILKSETHVLHVRAARHPAVRDLIARIRADGGTATFRDGQLVTQVRRSSRIAPATALRAAGVRVHAPRDGFSVPPIHPGSPAHELADTLREAAAIVDQQSSIALRGLNMGLTSAMRSTASALRACVPIVLSDGSPVDRLWNRRRAADIVDEAITRTVNLERGLERELFAGYRDVLRRALSRHPETSLEDAAAVETDTVAAARVAWDLASSSLPLKRCTYLSYYADEHPYLPGLRIPARRPSSARPVARVQWFDHRRQPHPVETLYLSLDGSRRFWLLWSDPIPADSDNDEAPRVRAIVARNAADSRTCLKALLVTAFRGAWETFTPPWDELEAGELLTHAEITQLAALMWKP